MRIQLKSIVATLLLSVPVLANAAWYQVEVVVFELKHPQVKDEKFPGPKDNQRQTSSRTLSVNGDAAQDAFVALPENQYKLNGAIANLEKSGQYKVLVHTAWRQPLEANSPAVRIEKDKELLGTLSLNNHATPHLNADLLLIKPIDPAMLDHALEENRSLNQEAIVEANAQMNNEIHYHLKQSQHFKTGEITYFDHPAFGMLVNVQPYDPKTGG